jgi:hypothetical protein
MQANKLDEVHLTRYHAVSALMLYVNGIHDNNELHFMQLNWFIFDITCDSV